MRLTTVGTAASLTALAAAARDTRGFAVMSFNSGGWLIEAQADPIVNPGVIAPHLHGVNGGSNFGLTVEGDYLLESNCTNAKIAGDFSNYWVPELFFQDPYNGTFEKVPLYYMMAYYCNFDKTKDDIEPFPVGMKMVSGDNNKRTPPETGGALGLDGGSAINPVQFHCPRTSYDPPSYPENSDGTTAGIQDPEQLDYGTGFPLYPCDGYYMRQDIHFPSCYSPEAGLNDYKNNMAWPTLDSEGYYNCPEGYTHVPHLFLETYWNTKEWDEGGRWTPDGKTQPYVFSNGDATGYSSHGDFLSGWDEDVLRHIINTCDRTDKDGNGMEECDVEVNTFVGCTIDLVQSSIKSVLSGITGVLDALPGDNTVTGFGSEDVTGSSGSIGSGSDSDSESVESATTSSTTSASSVAEPSVNLSALNAVKAVAPSSSEVAAAPAVTAAAQESDDEVAEDTGMKTVWEVETVYTTTTSVVEPTAVARRRSEHGHGGHHHRRMHGLR